VTKAERVAGVQVLDFQEGGRGGPVSGPHFSRELFEGKEGMCWKMRKGSTCVWN
jgi:hypothetical protein